LNVESFENLIGLWRVSDLVKVDVSRIGKRLEEVKKFIFFFFFDFVAAG
jgi:hypothetical protein